MGSIPYVYARSLEMEGRHPHDVGQWGVTNMRLLYLEGLPKTLEEFMVPINEDGTFQNTPLALRKAFWRIRKRFYRRIRSADEAAQMMKRGRGTLTKVCLPLFSSWVDPPDGLIPMPAPGEVAAPETHAIMLSDFFRLGGVDVEGERDARHFLFQNSWGGKWGKNGFALLPFAYYDRYAFEQWCAYDVEDLLLFQSRKLKNNWMSWQARDEFDRRVYAFEAGDLGGERLGWAFAIDTGEAVEVEELFVAPDARGARIGSELADLIVKLAAAKRLPIRLWVTFADTLKESPNTASALPHLAKRLGVQFHPSPVPWAAYFATSERLGSRTPIEPEHFPGRPKSTMGALAAFAASVAIAVNTGQPVLADEGPGVHFTSGSNLSLDSHDWAIRNTRRAALIRKKNREGLNPEEKIEFEQLQARARLIVETASPRPELLAKDLEALLAAKAAR